MLPGIHPAIVDADLFAAVQIGLDGNARRHAARPNRVATAALAGRVFDADGAPMSPTFSHGARGQVYRYYVSAPLQQGARPNRTDDASTAIRRVPAVVLEARFAEAMRRLLPRASDPLADILHVEIYPAGAQLLLPIALLPGIRSRLGGRGRCARCRRHCATAARPAGPAALARRADHHRTRRRHGPGARAA